MVGLVPTIHPTPCSGVRGWLDPRDKPEDDRGKHMLVRNTTVFARRSPDHPIRLLWGVSQPTAKSDRSGASGRRIGEHDSSIPFPYVGDSGQSSLMRKVVTRIALSCALLLGWLYGVDQIRDAPGMLPERLGPFLELISPRWLALALISASCLAGGALLWETIGEPRLRKRFNAELRRATEGGNYREVPADVALRVILNKSAWAWRALREFNTWKVVESLHREHFRDMALHDRLRVTGINALNGKRERIPKDRWRDVQLSELVSYSYGVQTELVRSRVLGEFDRHYHLQVAGYDIEQIPRASFLLRANTRICLWAKHAYWWLAPPGIRDNVRE